MPLVVGIFVGGHSRRMGGQTKGLLPTPERGEPIVVRLVRVVRDALGSDTDLHLVGRADDYAALGLPNLTDAVHDVGPLGGLIALLEHGVSVNCTAAIALAGDLPFVTAELIRRLAEHAPDAGAVAPRSDGLWQALFARYACVPALDVARARLAEGRRSLQGVLESLDAVDMPVSPGEGELLTDWDRPEDVR
jgi:molybdopterin-guanine dinucleotide biosynthesis protein A